MPSQWKKGISLALIFGAGLGVGIGLTTTTASPITATRQERSHFLNSPIVHPCNGTPWTLEEARRSAPFEVLMPDHDTARESSLKNVWRCHDAALALEFSSGTVVYLSRNTYKDPDAVWRSMAERYREFSVGTVRGVSAALADPALATGKAEGGVDLVEGGVRITVSGTGEIPLATLREVAESLR